MLRHHTTMQRRRRPAFGASRDEGASLMLALIFLVTLSVLIIAVIGFAQTALRAERSYQQQRVERYAGDGAVEAAIAWAQDRPLIGIQGPTAEECIVRTPAADPAPAIAVTCAANTSNGNPSQAGLTPEYAILTTGQRSRESPAYRGPTTAGGTVTAAPSYNGAECTSGDPIEQAARNARRVEEGIRFAAAPLEAANQDIDPCTTSSPVSRLLVTGKVFSGSGIQTDSGGEFDIVGGSVQYRDTCNYVPSSLCTPYAAGGDDDPMVPGATVEGADPRTDGAPNGGVAPNASWDMPDVSGLPTRSVPGQGDCVDGLVTFEPGYYGSVQELNDLFRAPACRNTTFWFQPDGGGNGVDAPDAATPNDKRGLYYFNFSDTSSGGCGRMQAAAGSTTQKQWCIGSDGSFNQRIVGGSPIDWDPAPGAADPASFPREITPDDVGGDCDETKPGVTFVMGGASHVYVADGSLELCAGPADAASTAPETAQRIALYGVPALQPARATGITAVTPPIVAEGTPPIPDDEPGSNGPAADASPTRDVLVGGTSSTPGFSGNALRIGEPTGARSATINIPNTDCEPGSTGVDPPPCTSSERYRAGTVQMAYTGPSTPAGTTVLRVLARATYNTNDANAAAGPAGSTTRVADPQPLLSVGSCTDATSRRFPTSAPGSSALMEVTQDVTACFSGAPGSFDATWTMRETEVCSAFGCNGPWKNTFDGLEFIVEVQGSGSVAVPQNECLTGWAANAVPASSTSPAEAADVVTTFEQPSSAAPLGASNYWNADRASDTTCAIVKVDQRRFTEPNTSNAPCEGPDVASGGFGVPFSCGRASFKGTIYAPSAIVDINDGDVLYPLFNRGIVVRGLMLRGLAYRVPVPFGNAPTTALSAGPRDIIFTACIRGVGRETATTFCDVAQDRIITRARVRYEVEPGYTPASGRARVPKVQWWTTDR